MAQVQNENDTLLCTHGDCQKAQVEDGEFCEDHIGGERVSVHFYAGYSGVPKCVVTIGGNEPGAYPGSDEGKYTKGKEYVLDITYLEAMLEKQIVEKGYTTSQSKRQKYPRLIINN